MRHHYLLLVHLFHYIMYMYMINLKKKKKNRYDTNLTLRINIGLITRKENVDVILKGKNLYVYRFL